MELIPDSIPESLWAEFRLMRKKIKAPMTEHAETIILCKLEKWRVEFGANPIDVLNESIEKSWRGVFLNGHGASNPNGRDVGLKIPNSAGSTPALPTCCLCGKSLQAGFIHTRQGKRCHDH